MKFDNEKQQQMFDEMVGKIVIPHIEALLNRTSEQDTLLEMIKDYDTNKRKEVLLALDMYHKHVSDMIKEIAAPIEVEFNKEDEDVRTSPVQSEYFEGSFTISTREKFESNETYGTPKEICEKLNLDGIIREQWSIDNTAIKKAIKDVNHPKHSEVEAAINCNAIKSVPVKVKGTKVTLKELELKGE